MHIEIHPLFCNYGVPPKETKEKDLWKPASPRVIDISIIRQVIPIQSYDKSIELARLQISDDHTEYIHVSKEEGDKISKLLLKNDAKNPVAKQLETMVGVLRLIQQVLAARLH